MSNLDLQKEQTARYFSSVVLLAGLCRALRLSLRRVWIKLLGRTDRIWSTLIVCSDRMRLLGLSQDLDPVEMQGWRAWDDESSFPLLSHPS